MINGCICELCNEIYGMVKRLCIVEVRKGCVCRVNKWGRNQGHGKKEDN
jgi:hypothetical protein